MIANIYFKKIISLIEQIERRTGYCLHETHPHVANMVMNLTDATNAPACLNELYKILEGL